MELAVETGFNDSKYCGILGEDTRCRFLNWEEEKCNLYDKKVLRGILGPTRCDACITDREKMEKYQEGLENEQQTSRPEIA